MDSKANEVHAESLAARGLIDWAIMGLPFTLAETVCTALVSIATTGGCRNVDQDWVLFGEVVEVSDGPPFSAQLRRVSLLSSQGDQVGEQWANFDIICPVTVHRRVDFTPGMLLGMYTKPSNRQSHNKVAADTTVPIWNISSFDRCLAWNATHLFAGAYEGWLRAMWWVQQANLTLAFATHTSVDWCPVHDLSGP